MFRKNAGLTETGGPSRAIKEDKRWGNIFIWLKGLSPFASAKYLKMIKIILTAASNWEVGKTGSAGTQ